MFGSATGAGFGTAQPAATSGFGTGAAATPTGFGSTIKRSLSNPGLNATAPKPPTFGGAFGGEFGSQTSTAPAAPAFGAAVTSTVTTNAFGSLTSTAPSGSTGTFGTPATTAPTTGLFASVGTPAGGGFGASTGASATGFGATSAPSGWGAANSTPATSAPGLQPQSMAQISHLQQHNQDNVWDQLMLIKEMWNPHSPLCQFKHYFYNLVDPQQVHLYTCPPDHDPALWDQAQQDNPDRTCLVPALAVGFEDLRKRAEQQRAESEAHAAKAEEIAQKLTQLQTRHQVDTQSKLTEYRRRNQEQSQRIQRLMKLAQVVRFRGQTLRPEEEIMRVRLERMQGELSRPGQLQRRAQDLWTQTQSLLAATNRVAQTRHGNIRYEVANDVDLETCVNLLDNYQAGLTQLTGVMQKDIKDTKALLEGRTA
ncbi:hypothetical protein IWQ60_006785 [Tieghemiomyces parasiticus]|uniref:Nucleoporin Nup54 alpha-helical domain-containing protein n=1 Tax=Tieghemiomyces parasiticus TaxID=78921 RepID=A0A9W8DWZ1_9FUNG|nr:hypothetical protein IWQ60_006785 [Tieghemiomyces parasiticus]